MKHRLVATVAASLLLASCGGYGSGNYNAPMTNPGNAAPASSTPAMTTTILGSPGFATPNGLTLYEFSGDGAGVSNCNGSCASIWPPFMATAGAQAVGSFTVIMRSDGSHQWAFKGHPLYTFESDSKPGMASGQGINADGGTFTVARP